MTKHKINVPEYTMLPNVIIDQMWDMSECQFRVLTAIARKTFGWQKQRDTISLSQIEEMTGLSRQGVSNGIQECLADGWISRTPKGQSFEYELLVNDVDQSDNELVNVVDQLEPKLVNVVDTQKKEIKEKQKKEGAGAHPAIKSTPPKAVEIFREATGRYPNKTLWDSMSQAIGDETDFWRDVVTAWVMTGWNPLNLKGMFDCFSRREIPGVRNPQRANNSRANKVPVNEDDEGLARARRLSVGAD